ncbi:type II toxin-antitoxin system RelE/ParE family toxin [Nocardioides sp. LMS-CY]|uniref:type II toxin-antitoxin system RelE/ParE family toxin n=1 Tax=Nocardioides sp. (strain LMS-CY) TaxID=2840457 RepID=UPI001BFFF596|nr:type II toxin-antitoxin system RelE/ParE family toxin [Nocardioides sp. LMS-CY]QWF23459.1 type II toxin-antitoxin system RelE/ParE family toxin [Nocardioides sp. LMS-CY]
MTLRFGRHAIQDLEEARDHYERITEELADGFVADLDRVVERMQMFPNGAAPVEGFPGVRRARMRRFPSGVCYRVLEPDTIEVLRIVHAARDSSGSGDEP